MVHSNTAGWENLETPKRPAGLYESMDPAQVDPPTGAPQSASTLFHYTRSISALEGILRDGFRPSYCKEDFGWVFAAGRQDDRFCIPMVSFCDIPLSRAGEHREGYGPYAIGLRKTWGLAASLSPVAYIAEGTPVAKLLRHLSADGSNEGTSDRIRALLAYTKPYQGLHPQNGRIVRFYDEREWRYIAPSPIWPRPDELIAKDDSGETLDPLTFAASQVSYLIVAEEREVPSFLSFIDELCANRNVQAEKVELMKSRVTSSERIRTDY